MAVIMADSNCIAARYSFSYSTSFASRRLLLLHSSVNRCVIGAKILQTSKLTSSLEVSVWGNVDIQRHHACKDSKMWLCLKPVKLYNPLGKRFTTYLHRQ